MSETNVKELIVLAEQGDMTAQADLGERYYKGNGVERNYEEAAKWLSKAAQPYIELCYLGKNYENDSKAAYAYEEMYDELMGKKLDSGSWATYWLGECYLHGYGVEKNVSKAIELWELASEEVDGVLMELANLYSDGIEFEPDYEKAVFWWKKAAHLDYNPNAGFPEARFELGICYYEGKGVEKDYQKAIEYFNLVIDDAPFGSDMDIEAESFIKKINLENGKA